MTKMQYTRRGRLHYSSKNPQPRAVVDLHMVEANRGCAKPQFAAV